MQKTLSRRRGHQEAGRIGVVGHRIGELGAPERLCESRPIEIPGQLFVDGLARSPCIQRSEIGWELGNDQIAGVIIQWLDENVWTKGK